MREVAETIGSTLADSLAVTQAEVEFLAGLETADEIVVPLVRCVLPLPGNVKSDDADLIVQQILLGITDQCHFQNPLLASGVDDAVQKSVQENAREFLSRKGGERISIPMTIRAGNGDIGHLIGTFGPRPPDALNKNKIQIHRATTVMLHTEKREGLATTIGARKHIAFRFSDQHKEALGGSLVRGEPMEITFEESLDAQGKRMLFVHDVNLPNESPEAEFSLN